MEPGSCTATTPSASSSVASGTSASAIDAGGRARDALGHEARGPLVQDARRASGRVPPDHAARGIGAALVDAGRDERRGAGDERVVVVGPERDQPARGGAVEVVGGGPSAEGVRVPPSPFDPGVEVAGRAGVVRVGRRADPAHELVDRRAPVEVHPRPLQRGVGQVQVGVGQPGDRHLVIAELQAARPGTGQARDVVRAPGGHHAAPSNRDRLGPRGPVRPRERRDPADHHQVGARGHPASTGSAGASSAAADAMRSVPSAASA